MTEDLAQPTRISRSSTVVVALGLVVLILAAFVLAISWLVAFPPAVLDAAWLVALVGAVTATVAGWRGARRAGVGFSASIKEAFRSLGEFILFFF